MSELLPILAIETSADICSICLFNSDEEYAEEKVLGKHIHSEKIYTIIENVCRASGVEKDVIKSVAISMGPGSFTGLRIGMAAAKSISMGLNVPLVPVPSFDAYALRLGHYLDQTKNIVIANNVNRDELYFSRYNYSDGELTCLDSPFLLDKTDLEKSISDNDVVFGKNSIAKDLPGSELSAIDIAMWSNNFGKDSLTFNYDYLEPNYLKNFVAKVKK